MLEMKAIPQRTRWRRAAKYRALQTRQHLANCTGSFHRQSAMRLNSSGGSQSDDSLVQTRTRRDQHCGSGHRLQKDSVPRARNGGRYLMRACFHTIVKAQLLSMEADEHTGKVTCADKHFNLLMPTVVLRATNEQTSNPREGGKVSTIQGRRVVPVTERPPTQLGSPRLIKSRAC